MMSYNSNKFGVFPADIRKVILDLLDQRSLVRLEQVSKGFQEMVQKFKTDLITHGCGHTLHQCFKQGHYICVKHIIENKRQYTSGWWQSLIQDACRGGHLPLVRYLFEVKPVPDSWTNFNDYFEKAGQSKNLELFLYLKSTSDQMPRVDPVNFFLGGVTMMNDLNFIRQFTDDFPKESLKIDWKRLMHYSLFPCNVEILRFAYEKINETLDRRFWNDVLLRGYRNPNTLKQILEWTEDVEFDSLGNIFYDACDTGDVKIVQILISSGRADQNLVSNTLKKICNYCRASPESIRLQFSPKIIQLLFSQCIQRCPNCNFGVDQH